MPPRYLYQRTGGPLVQWNRLRPPGQTRASDSVAMGSLGSLGDSDVFDTPRRLPRGGAPEYIADGFGCSDGGCKCGGKCGGMGAAEGFASPGFGVGLATGAIGYVMARKRGMGVLGSIAVLMGASTIGAVVANKVLK